jgi:hypothetical protein
MSARHAGAGGRHDFRCPGCHEQADKGEGVVEGAPAPGENDASICAHCGAALRWFKARHSNVLALRPMLESEIVQLPAEDQIALRLAQQVIHRSKTKPSCFN